MMMILNGDDLDHDVDGGDDDGDGDGDDDGDDGDGESDVVLFYIHHSISLFHLNGI